MKKKMANKKLWLGILVMVMVFGMAVVGCDPDNGNGNGNGNKPPEQKTTAERWGTWTDPSSTATITHSVAADGVCTITVGGTAETELPAWDHIWKVQASYEYTAIAGNMYVYTFEAWTDSNDRILTVEWYFNTDDNVYHNTGYEWEGDDLETAQATFKITSTRTTYTLTADRPIPKNKAGEFKFQCANKTGDFYVKVLSITPITQKSLVFTGIPADEFYDFYSNIYYYGGDVGLFQKGTTAEQALNLEKLVAVVGFQSETNYFSDDDWDTVYVILPLINLNNSPWMGSGSFDLYCVVNSYPPKYFKAANVVFSNITTATVKWSDVSEIFP